jgi:hypothetical protein
MPTKPDHFLADLHKPKAPVVTYQDGLRFGFGFVTAHLVVVAAVGLLAWLIILIFHLH